MSHLAGKVALRRLSARKPFKGFLISLPVEGLAAPLFEWEDTNENETKQEPGHRFAEAAACW